MKEGGARKNSSPFDEPLGGGGNFNLSNQIQNQEGSGGVTKTSNDRSLVRSGSVNYQFNNSDDGDAAPYVEQYSPATHSLAEKNISRIIQQARDLAIKQNDRSGFAATRAENHL